MANYQQLRYLLMTIDPVHIGAGGYRLGRVDNSIVREPGTHVPKIPGTSLHGAARSYAARIYESLASAGQKHDKVNCPATDPVCYTFGYIQGDESGEDSGEDGAVSYSGVINVFDAHVVLFPVHSMAGPVWVGTPERLKGAGFTFGALPESQDDDQVLFSWDRKSPLNLGWLMLRAGGQVSVTAPSSWHGERWDVVKGRIVVVSEMLFSHVVNSNLEVRTSVSIDPERGAAEDGALFTYEALPRATFLAMDVVVDDYRQAFPGMTRLGQWLGTNGPLSPEEKKRLEKQGWKDSGVTDAHAKLRTLNLDWPDSAAVLSAGLRMIEWLGVGGMGTRGFGRIAVVGAPLAP